MPREQGAHAGTAHRPAPPEHRPTLPEWMLNPPPARVTVGDRVAAALLRVPGAATARERWWRWRDRQRLHQRFPRTFKIVAFFGSWAIAVFLLLAAYALFGLA